MAMLLKLKRRVDFFKPKHKLEYAVLSVNQVSFLTEVASYSLISPMRLNFSLEFKQLVNSSVDVSPSLLKDGFSPPP